MAKNKERKVRTYAVKIYYTALQSEEVFEAVAESFIKYNNVDRQVADQSISLIRASLGKKDFADELLSKYLRSDWSIDRLPILDLIIFRLAINELFETKDVIKVIDDYVSIASKYSEPTSPAYINGILEKIHRDFKLGE
jgi:transcription antitermination factor NusB